MILKYICVLQIDNANVFICIFTILKTLGFFESFQLKKKTVYAFYFDKCEKICVAFFIERIRFLQTILSLRVRISGYLFTLVKI